MKRASLTACVVAFPLCSAAAQQDEQLSRVFNNLSHEAADCTAYLILVQNCIGESDQALADTYGVMAQRALQAALVFGEGANLLPETTTARVEMSAKGMMERVGQSCSNVSILLNEKSEVCRQLVESPESRAEYWMERYGPN